MLNNSFDYTWLEWEMWIWSIVELYVAIFAASAPALKPFFRRFVVDSVRSLSHPRDAVRLRTVAQMRNQSARRAQAA